MNRPRGALRDLALAGAAALALGVGTAEAACRQALVLALDVSGSVNAEEYRLQLDGIATALGVPQVRNAILAFPEAPVSLAVFEWSAGEFQRPILAWTALADDAAIDAVVAHLAGWTRKAAPQSTGLGAALDFADVMLAAGPSCWKRTLDVSADGKNNDWPPPRQVYLNGALSGVTVNALVIAGDGLTATGERPAVVDDLAAYFRAEVVRGPDAFVEVALGYEDYAAAMTRKLLREVETVAVGALPPEMGRWVRRQ